MMVLNFENDLIRQYSKTGEYGLERETLRINRDGTLAMSRHPFSGDKHIDRDFCENQIEVITDVFRDVTDLLSQLNTIQNKIDRVLTHNKEFLWRFSNPPAIGREEDIPVAVFGEGLEEKNHYRAYLTQKYGKKKMLFSGIHLNFSFIPELIQTAYRQSDNANIQNFKNDFYLRLSKRLTQYAWLVVFLTAASPVLHRSFGIESNVYSSVRCSEQGYWNHFVPVLDYSSFEKYTQSIQTLIDNRKISSVSELYYPVRLKPRGGNSLETLKENGVNHIELRVLDINPLSRLGILKEDILFIYLLILYLAGLPDFDFDSQQQLMAIQKEKQAAIFGNSTIKAEAARELHHIALFTDKYFPEYRHIVEYQKNKLHKGHSYAEIISRIFTNDYMKKGIYLARLYQESEKPCVSYSVFLPQGSVPSTSI